MSEHSMQFLVNLTVTRLNEVDFSANFLVVEGSKLEHLKAMLSSMLKVNKDRFKGLHEQAHYFEEPTTTPLDSYLNMLEKIDACNSFYDFKLLQEAIDDGWSEDEEVEHISNITITTSSVIAV